MRDLWFDVIGETLLDTISRAYTERSPIKYEKDKYVLTMELPGVKEKDLELSFDHEVLIVNSPRGGPYKLYVGADIDDEKIRATLEDGILTVVFPKKKNNTVKKITITKV